jgi:hypothetical protein
MKKAELKRKSPLRLLEKTAKGRLGRGHLGNFAARHGVGKTACLVHIGIEALAQGKKVLHVSFSETPNHIYSWYESIFRGLAEARQLDNPQDLHDRMARNRFIMNLSLKALDVRALEQRILELKKTVAFAPDVVIVDGYDFEGATPDQALAFKGLAETLNAEIWFSFVLHRREIRSTAGKVPRVIEKFLPAFSVTVLLDMVKDRVVLRLLTDHEGEAVADTHLVLDPGTFLIREE